MKDSVTELMISFGLSQEIFNSILDNWIFYDYKLKVLKISFIEGLLFGSKDSIELTRLRSYFEY